jgi:hypothetical protein
MPKFHPSANSVNMLKEHFHSCLIVEIGATVTKLRVLERN